MPLRLPDYASFDNFQAGINHDSVVLLRQFLSGKSSERTAYMWGESGVGKTHLLFSACKDIESSMYISMSNQKFGPDLLDSVAEHALICIDDFQLAAQQTGWEKRLMSMVEENVSENRLLLVAANLPPSALNLALPDLKSRISGRLVLRLRPIGDEDRIAVLIDRAARRGMKFESHVARYAISRYCRNMHSVLDLLQRVEQLTLEQHRRITIPLLNDLDRT